jgi:hypothetical protein
MIVNQCYNISWELLYHANREEIEAGMAADEVAGDRAEREHCLLSEAAFAVDWNRPEEDEAWSHLQPEGEDTGHGINDSH